MLKEPHQQTVSKAAMLANLLNSVPYHKEASSVSSERTVLKTITIHRTLQRTKTSLANLPHLYISKPTRII